MTIVLFHASTPKATEYEPFYQGCFGLDRCLSRNVLV